MIAPCKVSLTLILKPKDTIQAKYLSIHHPSDCSSLSRRVAVKETPQVYEFLSDFPWWLSGICLGLPGVLRFLQVTALLAFCDWICFRALSACSLGALSSQVSFPLMPVALHSTPALWLTMIYLSSGTSAPEYLSPPFLFSCPVCLLWLPSFFSSSPSPSSYSLYIDNVL